MSVSTSESGVLNFYRASQLHSGLILGQMVRRTHDARLILNLTRHCAEEVMHAQLWTETIIAIGGRPTSTADTYQARCAAVVGAPSTLPEVLVLTQTFERWTYRQFNLHLRAPGIHPLVAATLRRMSEKERGHLTWVKAWLEEQSKARGSKIREMMSKYAIADQRINPARASSRAALIA